MPARPRTVHGHLHGEAFMRMLYQCDRPAMKTYSPDDLHAIVHPGGACEWEDRLWNSRDGVTPFSIQCPGCGGFAHHVAWHLDEYAPTYKPRTGDRFFRDGTPDEARAIVRRRLSSAIGTPYEVPQAEWSEYIEHGVAAGSEFAPGWPHLEVAR